MKTNLNTKESSQNMRTKENSIIIGVDHGNAQVKTSHTSFQTSPVEKLKVDPEYGNILEYKKEFYRLKDNRLAVETDKSKSEIFFPLTLIAIAKELIFRFPEQTKFREDVSLAVGIPPSAFNAASRKTWQDYFLERMGGMTTFKYDRRSFTIHLIDCKCYPQGSVIVFDMLSDIIQTDMNGLLIDIGGYTTDIITLDPYAEKADRMKFNSIDDLGMNRFFYEMVERIQNVYKHKTTPSAISKALNPEKKNPFSEDELDLIYSSARDLTREIVGSVREQLPEDIRDYTIYFCGGGACALESFIRDELEFIGKTDNVQVIKDVHANARGFESAYLRDMNRKKNF